MANKDLFKQAIAEAKSIREAAIANAKEALEETLTPHLKDMLAAKLQEMEDAQNEEEVVNEVEEEIEETVEETVEEVSEEAEVEEEVVAEEEVEEAAKDEEAEDDSEESEDEAEEAEEDAEEDVEVKDMEVDDLKALIRDIIAQEMGAGEEEAIEDVPGEEDMIAADEQPAEEEEINLEELLSELAEMDKEEEANEEVNEEEIEEGLGDIAKKVWNDPNYLGAIITVDGKKMSLKDFMSMAASGAVAGQAKSGSGKTSSIGETTEELAEALTTIETLKSELSEVNLLNAKLLYVNKVFKTNNLTESQKVNVIAAFDKAETVKEVKLVFETVAEGFTSTKKETVKESKLGMASKATGTTASKPEVIAEVSDAVRRMQKLAGIIK